MNFILKGTKNRGKHYWNYSSKTQTDLISIFILTARKKKFHIKFHLIKVFHLTSKMYSFHLAKFSLMTGLFVSIIARELYKKEI